MTRSIADAISLTVMLQRVDKNNISDL